MPDPDPPTDVLWLSPSDGCRMEGASAEGGVQRAPVDLHRVFADAANDRLGQMLVLGWVPGAAAQVRSDAVLAGKRIVWAGTPAELAGLRAELPAAPLPAPPTLAVVENVDDEIALIMCLELSWSMAVLSGGEVRARLLRAAQRRQMMRGLIAPERVLSDLCHLCVRLRAGGQRLSLAALAGWARGRVAVCLAGGPSLDAGIDLVRRWQDRCVIICVDIIHHRVAAAGIRVDFVCTVDPHEEVAKRMHDCASPETILVAPIDGHPGVADRFRRIAYMVGGPYCLAVLRPQEIIPHGTNVGSTTVGLAQHLGCAGLVLVGHDLSFSRESYYSAFVEEREAGERRAAGLLVGRTISIPGNDGTEVATNLQFQMAAEDLGRMLLSRPEIPAWNLNLNLRRGARISGTVAIPDGWEPPLPPPPPPFPEPLPIADEALALLHRRINALPGAWAEERARSDVLATLRILGGNPEMRDVLYGMRGALNGHVLAILRWQGMSLTEGVAPVVAAAEAACDRIVDWWTGRAMAAFEGTMPSSSMPKTAWSAEQQAFFASLGAWGLPASAESDDLGLFEFVCRDLSALRYLDANRPIPALRTPEEYAYIIFKMRASLPEDVVHHFLAACACDPGRAALVGSARGIGLLPPDWLSADPPLREPGSVPVSIAAAEAVQRLRSGASTDPDADARRVVAWAPFQHHAVAALVARSRILRWSAALDALFRERLVQVDDAMAAAVVAGHHDVIAALDLIEPHRGSIGERSIVAAARRHLDIGGWKQALDMLERIRPQSNSAPDAIALSCEAAVASGDDGALGGIIAKAGHPSLAAEGLRRFLVKDVGVAQALQALGGMAWLAPDPRQAARWLHEALTELPAPWPTDAVAGMQAVIEAAVRSVARHAEDQRDAENLVTLWERSLPLVRGSMPGPPWLPAR